MTDVAIVSYSATFSNTSSLTINSNHSNAKFETSQQISHAIYSGDRIQLQHYNILFNTLGNNIEFTRPTNTSVSQQFGRTSVSASDSLIIAKLASGSNIQTGKILLKLSSFTFTAPSSSTPSSFVFTFER